MKKNTIIEAATPVEPPPVEPPALVPLAELAAEGCGWGGVYIASPRDAIDALAMELVGRGVEIELDDIGRRSVSRDTARRLLAERAEAEVRAAEHRRRLEKEAAAQSAPVWRGIPAVEGMSGLQVMLAADGSDERRKDKAGSRTWRLLAGESWGGTFGDFPAEEEE
jgi:hypothetical protein